MGVFDELFALAPLRQQQLDWFKRQGVPLLALADPLALRVAEVVFTAGNRFEFTSYRPADDAVLAAIIPAFDADGDLVDLVAWRPQSGAVGTWLGRASLLGEDHLDAPRLGEPLVVHDGVLDWMRAGREGVVVVDSRRAAPLLRDAGVLATASVEHGTRLRKMLAVRPPKVLVAVREAA